MLQPIQSRSTHANVYVGNVYDQKMRSQSAVYVTGYVAHSFLFPI